MARHFQEGIIMQCKECDSIWIKTDDALENAKLVSPSINCDWFTRRHLCVLQLWKIETLASFNRRTRMKAETRQISQKLAAWLKFVCCLRSVERIPVTTVFRKCWHLLKELWDRKREKWRTVTPSKKLCLEQGITTIWLDCTLPVYCLFVKKFFFS